MEVKREMQRELRERCPGYADCYSHADFIRKLGPLRKLYMMLSSGISPLDNSLEDNAQKPIFITGIHRSGTSWIGDIISLADNVMYWREPFNPSVVKSMCQQYLYLSSAMENQFYDNFTKKIFEGKYTGSLFDYTKPSQWFGVRDRRHLIKDPTAAFMLEWIMNRYDLNVVVVARHPAGFISSILKLNWDFDFNWFLNQEQLMTSYLDPFKSIINKYNYKGMDVEKGAVLWSVIYYVLEKISLSHEVTWVMYEDICARPQEEFKRLLNAVNLEWNSKIERKLYKSVTSTVTFANNITSGLDRDAAKMGEIWKERMTSKEIKMIDALVTQFNIALYDQYKLTSCRDSQVYAG